jgi:hypothetical protein
MLDGVRLRYANSLSGKVYSENCMWAFVIRSMVYEEEISSMFFKTRTYYSNYHVNGRRLCAVPL